MDLRTLRYFVAVADELHFGRAAARLHMTQPPLSRAIKQLETDLGAVLLNRSPTGVTLTPAGAALHDEARALLAQADQVRAKVTAATTLTIGTLADSVEQAGSRLVAVFRERHPGVHVRIRETDLADPTAGLRSGLADVVFTRTPFGDTGMTAHILRTDPVGVVLRADDPLAARAVLDPGELADRRWFRLPAGTDPVWCAYWAGPGREGPVVRTVHECMQAVLWNGTVGVAPLGHPLPDGLTAVPLRGKPPCHLVVAWQTSDPSPLVRSFADLVTSAPR
ncbi:LysR family transcriptional regulator [Actinophytocola algeriensis]|uniref:DNA-binding transcriptional LysR family regulator n=1 Tax=Actinophytocola algeriensis TaxID=1768010 RepID=A0A7W7Q9D4_9PSEU|nr:LysR family transcriptional regulator [Actinophytocola algeriensis]MBB4909415.1 DNA-binding transcriptional LysR family regulator [Actinophytocola algeriensis]MBE1475405.1 DNA-binding transcriptional LysR family regulator [Actinophytocola algeriensis]